MGANIYQITVKTSGEIFACADDKPILDAAHAAGILIGYSCRGGRCGSCRGRVLRGQVEYPAGLPEALSAADSAAGYVLFCSARAVSDMTIELLPPNFGSIDHAKA